MLCDRCRAEIEADPLPPEIDGALWASSRLMRTILRVLWCNRGAWVSTERLLGAMYADHSEPAAACRQLPQRDAVEAAAQIPTARLSSRNALGRLASAGG